MASTGIQTAQRELKEESDFHALLSPLGLLSVCGFGSLLSERSARSTFPNLINFRVSRLNGFRRVFAHVAPIFFERGIAKPETKEISSLSVEPCEGETLIITVFEIDKSEIPAFIEREHEFRFLSVVPETLDGMIFDHAACGCRWFVLVIVMMSILKLDVKETRRFMYNAMEDIKLVKYGEMTYCLVEFIFAIAKNLGSVAHANFLDHTFLGDRRTTIRTYLSTMRVDIMDEDLPEPIKARYGG